MVVPEGSDKYQKRSVPMNDPSIFLKNFLLNETRFLALPPP
jgi:hypothetical protein